MARTFDGSTNFFVGDSPISSAPLTIAAWINTSNNSDECVISVTNGTTDGNSFRLRVLAGVLHARTQGAGGGGVSSTISTVPTNTPCHVAGVFASTSSRVAYLDGVAATAETSTRTPAGVNKVGIGTNASAGNNGEKFTGAIYEIAIWDAALTAAEITSLAKGFSPKLIRPDNLVSYRRFVNSTNDLVSTISLTETGTTTVTPQGRGYG